ncbi:MAG: tetratricopeptide repeat protein, partial [Acidobacteriaceae bacterium]|nr:tetratricopeptide repeat protein [Acidobacteriaceae bacterium]
FANTKGGPPALDRAAQYYWQAGEHDRALTVAAKDATAAYAWADRLLHKEDFEDAAEVVQKALESHPHHPQLTLALGVARYGQRRFMDAIALFLDVIQSDPAIPQPYDFIGRMLDQAGDRLPEITRLYEKRAAANAGDERAQLLFAKALLASDAKDGRAEPLLKRATDLDSNDWEAHYLLGTVLSSRHQYDGAAKELARAVELNPKDPMPHYQLARVYDRLGENEKAEAERAIHAQLIGTGK